MHAPFLATSSRTSRPASETPVDASPCRPTTWGVRIVQIVLAIYLLPVLAVLFLIGGAGMAVVGLAALVARAPFWFRGGGSSDPEVEEDAR
jgi:hypothetical protein